MARVGGCVAGIGPAVTVLAVSILTNSSHRPASPRNAVHRIGAALAIPILLAGCSQAKTTGESQPPTAAASASASATGSAPASASSADSLTFEGVTVTGAKGETPTISLADDFAPATELKTVDIYKGAGDPVVDGATVTTNYVGMDQQSKTVFDSSFERGEPASFPLDGVIVGWQEGLLGMQPGGRRLLIIPGSLAYGAAGRPPAIGPDDTLVFVVDMLETQSPDAPASS